jgi:hypothetical protein
MDLRQDQLGKSRVRLFSWMEPVCRDVFRVAGEHLAVPCEVQKVGARFTGYRFHAGVPRRYESVNPRDVGALHSWEVGEIGEAHDQNLYVGLSERQGQITKILEKGAARVPCQDVICSEEDCDEAGANR